jgi:hypothetical protein
MASTILESQRNEKPEGSKLAPTLNRAMANKGFRLILNRAQTSNADVESTERRRSDNGNGPQAKRMMQARGSLAS